MKDIFLNGKAPVTLSNCRKLQIYYSEGAYTIEDHWHTCMEILLPFPVLMMYLFSNSTFILKKEIFLFLHSGTVHSLSAKNRGTRLILQFDIELLYAHREFQTLLFSMPPCIHLKRKTSASTYREKVCPFCFLCCRNIVISTFYGHLPFTPQPWNYTLCFCALRKYRCRPFLLKRTDTKFEMSASRKNFLLYADI